MMNDETEIACIDPVADPQNPFEEDTDPCFVQSKDSILTIWIAGKKVKETDLLKKQYGHGQIVLESPVTLNGCKLEVKLIPPEKDGHPYKPQAGDKFEIVTGNFEIDGCFSYMDLPELIDASGKKEFDWIAYKVPANQSKRFVLEVVEAI